MKKLRSILGHSGAVLTLVLALLSPFLLFGWFEKAIGAAGLHISPVYSGGEVARVIAREGYRIVVYRPTLRGSPLQRIDPFIQMRWTPEAGLPNAVVDDVDLDGDGTPDVQVRFNPARLVVDVSPLDRHYRPMHSAGVISFSALIGRVGEDIVVRIPLENSKLK
jgi:hypothetical protein